MPTSFRGLTALLLAFSMLFIGLLPAAQANTGTLDVDRITTVAEWNRIAHGESFEFTSTIHVSGAAAELPGEGQVEVYETADAQRSTPLGVGEVNEDWTADITVSGLDVGTYHFTFVYTGTDQFAGAEHNRLLSHVVHDPATMDAISITSVSAEGPVFVGDDLLVDIIADVDGIWRRPVLFEIYSADDVNFENPVATYEDSSIGRSGEREASLTLGNLDQGSHEFVARVSNDAGPVGRVPMLPDYTEFSVEVLAPEITPELSVTNPTGEIWRGETVTATVEIVLPDGVEPEDITVDGRIEIFRPSAFAGGQETIYSTAEVDGELLVEVPLDTTVGTSWNGSFSAAVRLVEATDLADVCLGCGRNEWQMPIEYTAQDPEILVTPVEQTVAEGADAAVTLRLGLPEDYPLPPEDLEGQFEVVTGGSLEHVLFANLSEMNEDYQVEVSVPAEHFNDPDFPLAARFEVRVVDSIYQRLAVQGNWPTFSVWTEAEPEHPAWDASTVYTGGQIVEYDGRVFEALWWTQNQQPGASPYSAWSEIGAPTVCASGTYPAWAASTEFTGGETVVFNGTVYTAKWYSRNQEPGDQWGPWEEIGDC
ncbi:carbohydrate-binding protein [Nesterenkonia ebinurensis]|uniref:carbohydrate-binding protein n=1 Tax=Nesterenkonia ebinurensis TaxID=2608252 RepID=UPI00123D9DB6|nr:carbohydrate-binding protein [Nesterenkonia ebinurensis]